jgi:cell division septation protein DedD
MSRNDAGEAEGHEFELMLGNKQLLSVFFVVVILLGVFFTMGYVVGRNSSPVDTVRKSEPYDRQNAPSAVPTAAAKKQAPPVVIDERPAPTTVAPTAAAPSKPIEIPPVTVSQPQIGQTYLQVLAVAKAEADILADLLAKKGFHALVTPGPNDKVFRVLVGPARDAADAGKLKSDLEAAGFKPFFKKY